MNMNQQLGAHELLEVHEVLTNAINGINTFQLLIPHCQDQDLRNIMQNQLNFMINEYNGMVTSLSNKTGGGPAGAFRPRSANFNPTYGLDNPAPFQPNATMQQIDDRDISSAVLGCHKASATVKMHAALECADPMIRGLLLQGARNCAEQAYETWSYMNQKGYYQVPTLKEHTAGEFAGQYKPFGVQGMPSGLGQTMNQGMPGMGQNAGQDYLG